VIGRLSRRATRSLLALVAGLVAAGCSTVSTGPPPAATLVHDIAPAVEAGELPPDEPPEELLVEKEPEKQADRLLEKGQQKEDFCKVMGGPAGYIFTPEPAPDDLEELVEYASLIVFNLRTLDPDSEVRNPDRPDEDIDLPEAMYELVQVVRREMYAYSVRVAYIQALLDKDLIDQEEVDRRLDLAFVALYRSDYTDADRELTKLVPRYCQ
jgi:hypothetical protein